MKNIERKSLREVCELINRGISPKYSDEGNLIINQKCIRNNTVSVEEARYSSAEKKISEEKYLRPLDILVNSTGTGTLGRTAQIKEIFQPTSVDTHVTIVRPNNQVDKTFIALQLALKEPEIVSLGKGATNQQELGREELGNIEMLLPPINIQRKIAGILSNYDNLIEINIKRIKLFEELAQRIYEEWFVKFKVNGKQLKVDIDSGLPKGWVKKTIGDMIEVGRGSSPRPIADQRYFEGGTIPWLKIADATASNIYIHKTKEHVNEFGASFSRKLKPGSLIVAASGTLGFPMFLSVEACIHDGWIYFEGITEELKEYFYYSFIGLRKHFESISYGAAIQNINTGIVKSATFILPPETILVEFKNIVAPLFKAIENTQNQNINLKESRDILLSKLMNGVIEIN